MRKSLVLLGVLDDSDVEWMLRAGAKRQLKPGDRLITEGQAIDSLHVVLTGAFGVLLSNKQRVAPLLAGDIVGEMSFLDARPPSATVVAEEVSWVLDVPRQDVRDRLADNLGFAARFYRAVAVFLSLRMRATAAQLGFGQARRDDEDSDASEMPEDVMEQLSLAGQRFLQLQERARVAA
jgi:CRP/FNR family cyclic AMP-dependent transcriptional regulator